VFNRPCFGRARRFLATKPAPPRARQTCPEDEVRSFWRPCLMTVFIVGKGVTRRERGSPSADSCKRREARKPTCHLWPNTFGGYPNVRRRRDSKRNRLMRNALHNPEMPGNSPPSVGGGSPRPLRWEDLHTALDTIIAAAANLRHYRDRLTSNDYTVTVGDIEQAAEQISHGLAMRTSPARAVVTREKRRTH